MPAKPKIQSNKLMTLAYIADTVLRTLIYFVLPTVFGLLTNIGTRFLYHDLNNDIYYTYRYMPFFTNKHIFVLGKNRFDIIYHSTS